MNYRFSDGTFELTHTGEASLFTEWIRHHPERVEQKGWALEYHRWLTERGEDAVISAVWQGWRVDAWVCAKLLLWMYSAHPNDIAKAYKET